MPIFLLLILLWPWPSHAEDLTMAKERDAFLNQFQNNQLSPFQRGVQEPPVAYEFNLPANQTFERTYEGANNAYQLKLIEPKIPKPTQRFFQKGQGEVRVKVRGPGSLGGVREFVVFARCVIRAFYIQRFEANDDPTDPIGHGTKPDELCPEDPSHYLQQAQVFSKLFFGL